MSAPTRLSGLTRHLPRPAGCFNRTQWRAIDRQWQRYLSQTPPRRPVLPKHPRSLPSTTRSASSAALNAPPNRLRNLLYGSGLVLFLAFGYLYITDTRASIHQWLIVPSLRYLHADPEDAHHAGIRYIKGLYNFNLHPRERSTADAALGDLTVGVFGHVLDNPVGTSAGIDKNAQIPGPLFALGPSVVEVGGATPHPQQGNPKPRVFRIPSQNALINRYGLNSEGAEYVAMQLRERVRQYAYDNGLGLEPESERQVLDGEAGVPPGSLVAGRLLAVNIGKNKDTPDQDIAAVARDYVYCVEHLAKYADILVVNVSSPNTPGLRDLQAAKPLTTILTEVVKAAKSCTRATKPAVMVKVSPDEDSDTQIEGICSAVWASGVDGVIVGNTTKKRPDPVPRGYVLPAKDEKVLTEIGGYSGPQLFERTLALVGRYRERLDVPPPSLRREADEAEQNTKSVQSKPISDGKKALEDALSAPTSNASAKESTKRDLQRLKPLTPEHREASEQPLLKLPERHADSVPPSPASPSSSLSSTSPASSQSTPPASTPPAPSRDSPQQTKVIFATGGITTGEQCLQVLNAGASVCQVYTAMMYGGVGTVTRMKAEMRDVMYRGKGKKERGRSPGDGATGM